MRGTPGDFHPTGVLVSRILNVGPEFDDEVVILLLRSTFAIVSSSGFELYSLKRVLVAIVCVAGGRERLRGLTVIL